MVVATADGAGRLLAENPDPAALRQAVSSKGGTTLAALSTFIDGGIFGGTCINVGCIPTKMYVYPAEISESARELDRLGVSVSIQDVRWREIRDRIFGRIDAISAGGLDWRERSENVTVFHGEASFVDNRTLRIGDDEISADRIVIATGSRPRRLDVPGLDIAFAADVPRGAGLSSSASLAGSMVQ